MQAFFISFSEVPAPIALSVLETVACKREQCQKGLCVTPCQAWMIAISWRGLLRSSQLCTTVARTGSFGGIVLALGENRGAREAAMRFRLTFICREPSCDKTAVVLYDARPGETVQQFRQRNPIFLAVLCGAKHAGNYPASTAVDITVPAQRTKSTA